jgi:hypothetical protein
MSDQGSLDFLSNHHHLYPTLLLHASPILKHMYTYIQCVCVYVQHALVYEHVCHWLAYSVILQASKLLAMCTLYCMLHDVMLLVHCAKQKLIITRVHKRSHVLHNFYRVLQLSHHRSCIYQQVHKFKQAHLKVQLIEHDLTSSAAGQTSTRNSMLCVAK